MAIFVVLRRNVVVDILKCVAIIMLYLRDLGSVGEGKHEKKRDFGGIFHGT